MRGKLFLFFAAVFVLFAPHVRAVLFASTGDPLFNTTAPTGAYDGSGWQFQGRYGDFLGTPIAPHYFVTAKHIFTPGTPFIFMGQSYTMDAVYDDPNSDLRIWHVTTPFPAFAPLYTRADEVGKEMVVFGRGLARGAEIADKGWLWSESMPAQRWGTNVVTAITDAGAGFGLTLEAAFDLGASKNEATLSVRDSGGGVFIRDGDGVWKLAGINLAVSGPYKVNLSDTTTFNAALYDQSGYFAEQFNGSFAAASGPGSFYATRISSNTAFIQQITGVPEPAVAVTTGVALALLAMRRRR